MQAYSLQLFPLARHSSSDRALQRVSVYAALATAIGRCGARWYGLVYGNAPLLAFFVDDGWYENALSVGLAIGSLEFGLFLSFRRTADAQAGILDTESKAGST